MREERWWERRCGFTWWCCKRSVTPLVRSLVCMCNNHNTWSMGIPLWAPTWCDAGDLANYWHIRRPATWRWNFQSNRFRSTSTQFPRCGRLFVKKVLQVSDQNIKDRLAVDSVSVTISSAATSRRPPFFFLPGRGCCYRIRFVEMNGFAGGCWRYHPLSILKCGASVEPIVGKWGQACTLWAIPFAVLVKGWLPSPAINRINTCVGFSRHRCSLCRF